MRAFLAVVPDSTVNTFLLNQIARLRQETWAKMVKWEPPDKLHLTLKFLGEISPEQATQLIARLSDQLRKNPIAVFEIQLENVRFLPSRSRPNVVVQQIVTSPELLSLFRLCESAAQHCGLPAEKRGFHGHLTLGRVKAPLPMHAEIQPHPAQTRMRVNRLMLMQSELKPTGSIYKQIGRWDL
jgi:2'-5' RNA ligase